MLQLQEQMELELKELVGQLTQNFFLFFKHIYFSFASLKLVL